MKRGLLVVFFILILCTISFARMPKTSNVFSGTVAAGETINLNVSAGEEGFFSVQPIFTGSGTLRLQYQTSNDNTNWSTAASIIDSASSGTVYPYPATGVNIFARYQRLVISETGSANPVVITGLWRCVQ